MSALPGKLFLAPMAELSTPALRLLVKEFCPGAVLSSEMVSAGALVTGGTHNEPLIRRHEFDDPFVYQIVGADPAVMAAACGILSARGCDGIDINMGCPNHEIVKKGQGAKLLTDPAKARAIVRACRKATRIRLSVKMRTGWDRSDERDFTAFIAMLQDEGVDHITVHPRCAKLSLTRTSDWRFVALAKETLSIPVVGNGDVDTPGGPAERMSATGCDGVMIGRGAARAPWIFRPAEDILERRESEITVDVHGTWTRALAFMERCLPERLHRSRGHRFCAWYAANARFGHELFSRIRREADLGRMRGVIDDYYGRNPAEALLHIRVCGGKAIVSHPRGDGAPFAGGERDARACAGSI